MVTLWSLFVLVFRRRLYIWLEMRQDPKLFVTIVSTWSFEWVSLSGSSFGAQWIGEGDVYFYIPIYHYLYTLFHLSREVGVCESFVWIGIFWPSTGYPCCCRHRPPVGAKTTYRHSVCIEIPLDVTCESSRYCLVVSPPSYPSLGISLAVCMGATREIICLGRRKSWNWNNFLWINLIKAKVSWLCLIVGIEQCIYISNE